MENVKFNKCQTPLEDLHLEKYPSEVVEQFVTIQRKGMAGYQASNKA